MTSLVDLVPDFLVLRNLLPEELAFHLLKVARSNMQRGMFTLESLRSHRGVGMAATPEWGYGHQYEDETELIVTEAWRWLEFNLFILPAQGINGNSGWRVLGRRGRQIIDDQSFDRYRKAAAFPQQLLHPSIAEAVWPALLRGELDTAVFIAFRMVEEAVRKAGGFTNADTGVPLMRKAFDAKAGKLRNPDEEEAEREALAHLFAGAIGSYKNPRSHRTVGLGDASEAQEMVMLASHLLRIVDSRKEGQDMNRPRPGE
jgi:uncharacterized protein (TIGR02391 family)